MDKPCEYCGKMMMGVRSDKKYCSRSCSGKAQRERQKLGIDLSRKVCLKCGKEFTVKTSGYSRVYCYDCIPDNGSPKSGAEMRKIIKRWTIEEKGGKCQLCGYNCCDDALDLHHINPRQKEFSISDRNLKYTNWPSIRQEIEKGILVCSNCHREIHAGLYPEYLKGDDD